MKNTHFSHHRNGFVLSLVLWISAAMMLLALLFVKFSKEEFDIYKKLHQKLKVELATEALFEKISFYVSTGTTRSNYVTNRVEGFPVRILLDNRKYTIKDKENNMTCTYALLDHSALYNLRHLYFPDQVQNMIAQLGNKEYHFADLYLDWIDTDKFSRVNGAEESDYLLDGYRYVPANYSSFQHASAVCLLKDFCNIDKNISEDVQEHLSSYGYQALNINLIDKVILHAIFSNMSDEEIESILDLRTDDYGAYKKLFTFLPVDSYGASPSRIMTISLRCRQQGVASRLDAIADFRAFKNRSWTLFEMKKN